MVCQPTGNCQCRWQVTLVTVHHNDRAAGWGTLATVSESESAGCLARAMTGSLSWQDRGPAPGLQLS